MSRMTRWGVLILVVGHAGSPARSDEPATVAATVSCSMPTSGNNIRQLAFDGDPATFFASEGEVGPEAVFVLRLDEPVAIQSLAVTTGREDGSDRLDSGVLEVSSDGQTFEALASLAEGTAKASIDGRKIKAIQIRPGDGERRPLVVREIAIESEQPVARFRYPVEITVIVDDAPEMKAWAENVAAVCERWYPRINDELKSDGYRPARQITMTLSTAYKGVAEAGGRRITGSVQFFKDHPDDVGAMVHETTHVIQRYRGRDNPGWLVEGVADYIRFFVFEPGKLGRINANRAKYNDSYRTSAAFLAYLTDTYDKQIVNKLNALMRSGSYSEDAFKDITGKPLQELGEEWRNKLNK